VQARRDGQPWRVGIEAPDRTGAAARIVHLHRGGLATSGDSRRFVMHEGRRYSHILDARTGWPIQDAPRSITVAADTCTQAGTLTTLAMLQGTNAEQLLRASGSRYWIE
jgi:thiamine biosynthesis lipoprotein